MRDLLGQTLVDTAGVMVFSSRLSCSKQLIDAETLVMHSKGR